MQISEELENAILDVMENITGAEPYENHFTDVHKLEHESTSGFIPFYNGGYRCMIISDLALACGSGSHSKAVEPFIITAIDDALEDYQEDNPEFNIDDASVEQMDDYQQLEYEALCEGGGFAYELLVIYCAADNDRNTSGEDELIIQAGTNTDFEYMRYAGLQKYFEKTIKVSGIADEDHMSDILQDALNSI